VRELDLDLDAFEGPFDLLLTLVLKEELEPGDVDVAGIVLRFLDDLAARAERDEQRAALDLDACGEFLVLVAALLELKARGLFLWEQDDLDELDAHEAAEELARRLAEYRRIREAAGWLTARLAEEGGRYFRLGPAPLVPRPERRLALQDPAVLAEVFRRLAAEPPAVSLGHMALRFPPVSQFLARFRVLLGRRRRFDFETEVSGLDRAEAAVAFLALLELRKAGEVELTQAAPFAPIRVARAEPARPQREESAWIARSA
jgi:segregation and condensation protein A